MHLRPTSAYSGPEPGLLFRRPAVDIDHGAVVGRLVVGVVGPRALSLCHRPAAAHLVVHHDGGGGGVHGF